MIRLCLCCVVARSRLAFGATTAHIRQGCCRPAAFVARSVTTPLPVIASFKSYMYMSRRFRGEIAQLIGMKPMQSCCPVVNRRARGVRAQGTAKEQASEDHQVWVILAVDPDMSGALAVLQYKMQAKDTPNEGPGDIEELVCYVLYTTHHTTRTTRVLLSTHLTHSCLRPFLASWHILELEACTNTVAHIVSSPLHSLDRQNCSLGTSPKTGARHVHFWSAQCEDNTLSSMPPP
jgi:hypothetical protein